MPAHRNTQPQKYNIFSIDCIMECLYYRFSIVCINTTVLCMQNEYNKCMHVLLGYQPIPYSIRLLLKEVNKRN